MTEKTKQNVEYTLVKEMPIDFLVNKYIGRVYLFFAPVRLVFILDDAGDAERRDPTNEGYWHEFFCSDDKLDPAVELYDDIVDELCGGFMCETEEEEQEIRGEAEGLAMEIVGELSSLVETQGQ